jgi:hypothetical protein
LRLPGRALSGYWAQEGCIGGAIGYGRAGSRQLFTPDAKEEASRMTKIKKYIPEFFTDIKLEEAEFETLEELLRINFVRKWVRDKDFSWLAYTCYTEDTWLLTAILNDRDKQYPIGFLDHPPPGGIIKWTP